MGEAVLFSYFCSKTSIVGEAGLACTPDLCFDKKCYKYNNFSSENYHFDGRENLQYIA